MSFFSWLINRMSNRQTKRRAARPNVARFCPQIEALETRAVLSATLLDANPGPSSSNPTLLTDVNGTAYFTAEDAVHGRELWKSDGTAAGTGLIKEIKPGNGFFDLPPRSLTDVNGTLFFTAADAIHGWELWKSDGTDEGTVLVKDIIPGIGGSVPHFLTNVNGTLFFVAEDAAAGGVHGAELWMSDGTDAGTVMVKDIYPGTRNSAPDYLTNVNGTLYFTADDGVHGRELWRSDGTGAGTVLVRDFYPGAGGSSPFSLTNVNGAVFFVANSGNNGLELWKSDGTDAGTTLVHRFAYAPRNLTNVNGVLYLAGYDDQNGSELWKSNGTTEGTVLVKDVLPGAGSSFDFSGGDGNLTNVSGTLYFSANDGVHGTELWKSDGTADGTLLVKDIRPGGGGLNFFSGGGRLANVNGRLFFVADDGVHGAEPWTSDGTAAGTVLVQDIFPGIGGSHGSNRILTNVGGTLYFSATDGVHGYELWRVSQVLHDDAVKTAQDTPLQVVALGNDFLAPGSLPVISSITQPGEGAAVVNPDGAITYTPSAGFSGVDSFTYTVTNRFGDIDTATVTVRVVQPVQIDIKPGSTANAVNLNNDGTIAVVLFSTANFDATTVDIGTVLFAGAGVNNYGSEDVNGDGRLDMVLHFRIDDTNLREVYEQLLLADADDGSLDTTRQQTTLLLSGGTTSGGLFEGLDAATLFMSGKELNDLLIALGLK